jgi:hypothetical protein
MYSLHLGLSPAGHLYAELKRIRGHEELMISQPCANHDMMGMAAWLLIHQGTRLQRSALPRN